MPPHPPFSKGGGGDLEKGEHKGDFSEISKLTVIYSN